MTISIMFRCACGRHWMRHTTGPIPAFEDCPDCGEPGTPVQHGEQKPIAPPEKKRKGAA